MILEGTILNKKLLIIKPIDWVCFRTSRNFSSIAETHFPNSKSFYGAIYGELYRQKKMNLKNIKEHMTSARLDLTGPFIYEHSQDKDIIFFRIPSILKYNEDDKKFYEGYPDTNTQFCINKKHLYVIMYDSMNNLKDPEKQYITLQEFESLKKGELSLTNEKTTLPFEIDRKIGIALENGLKTAKEGMLYSISYYTFKNDSGYCFFIEKDEDNILEKIKSINIGTKSRICTLEIKEIETTLFDKIHNESKCCVLLTPACFKNGIIPEKNDSITAISNYKSETIGFWDSEKREVSTMFKAVPAGSTYFIERDIDSLTDYYHHYGFGKFAEIPICRNTAIRRKL